MIVLIVFTIFFHLTMNSGYQPLIAYLPLSVAPKIHAIQYQDVPEQSDNSPRFSHEEKKEDQSSELVAFAG
jgi:hypothetical protein